MQDTGWSFDDGVLPMSLFRLMCMLLLLMVSAGSAWANASIAFAEYTVPDSGTVVVPVAKGENRGTAFAQVDTATAGALSRAVGVAGFEGKQGERLSLPGIGGFDQVLLVGIGDGPVTPRLLQDFGGTAVQGLAKGSRDVEVLWPGNEPDAAAHIALGATLGQYSFDLYKTAQVPAAGKRVTLRTPQGASAAAVYESQWRPLADAVVFARDIVTEPANAVWPEEFVARTRKAFAGVPNVSFEVLDVPAMEKLGMDSILAVGKGSVRPPRLLLIRYDGGKPGEAPLAFVGKGITFDTGGISLKQNDGMWRMKYDMTGAASSVGAVLALAGRKAPVNAVAVAALAENMPSGSAVRPGDVIKSMAGRTYEVMSTDAEGRMVLVDALTYVQRKHKPRLIVDVATLTGAIVSALGDEYAGLFANDDTLAAQLTAAGEAVGEEMWRMPIHPSYAKDLASPIADLRNRSSSTGAGAAAYFLREWIEGNTPWAHLDIAGMAWRESDGTPTSPRGATAYGVRLFDQLVRDHYE